MAEDRHSAQIIKLFRAAAFGPKRIAELCSAYDIATKSLQDRGRRPKIVNEVIAQRIIALAETGERDPARLAAGALRSLGFEDR